jgi:pyruvate, water dikinase
VIVSLSEATPDNACAKAATLGRLTGAGHPVPPGFVVSTAAYRSVVKDLDLAAIAARHGAEAARQLVESQPFPPSLRRQLASALAALGDPPVAVRSSATTEDTRTHSGAGQHDSYLGVHGLAAVVDQVRACWGSLWSSRAVADRQLRAAAPDAEPGAVPGLAVLIQRHVDADVAGVLFTADHRADITPDTPGPPAGAVLEASWGLGDSVVQGLVTPDQWTVTGAGIVHRQVGNKPTRTDRRRAGPSAGGTATSPVPAGQRHRPCLDDDQVLRLAELGRVVAADLGAPQDIEWAIEQDRIWLLQSRPVTAALAGVAGSPGTATGPARLVNGVADFRKVAPGDILVCRFTDPAWTPLFGIVAAVVTETGGRLCHAAIVARERGIPAALGIPGVMSSLRDGQPVRVDGATGTVHVLPRSAAPSP